MLSRVAAWTLALGMIMPAAVASAAPARVAAAPVATTCGYATGGSGHYLNTLCWIDMTGYNDAAAQAPGGFPMTVSLPGGYTASFTVTSTLSAANNFLGSATHAVACGHAFPTFSGAALGNGWYNGVPGKPALLQNHSVCGGTGNDTTLTLSGITVTDPSNNPVGNYGLVMANAEATAAGNTEEDIYSTNGPVLNLLEEAGSTTNAFCYSTLAGLGTSTVSCGANGSAGTGGNPGNPILQAIAPSTVSARLITNGGEAVAFGVLVAKVNLTKTITARTAPNDSFDLKIAGAGGSTIASGTTGPTATTGSTGSTTVLTALLGDTLTLSETASAGTTDLATYTSSWSCTNAAIGSATALPSGSGTSKNVGILPGDDISCTITNSIPVTLTATKSGTGTGTVTDPAGTLACGSTCSETELSGTTVTLTAAPGPNSTFTGWTAGCTSNPTPTTCVTTLAGATTVNAQFDLVQVPLTVSTNGGGSGIVTGGGINCGTTCSVTDPFGTVVTLTATPAPGSVFAGWTGCDRNPTPTTCVTTLTGAASVTATFTRASVPPLPAMPVHRTHHANCNNDPNDSYANNPAFCPAAPPTH